MDDMVKAAMLKWPNVPACYGWLGLDARGRWWMRDAQAQAAGPFAGVGAQVASRGEALRHEKLIEFIGRNYAQDERGCWYFQNGPQRVFVELTLAPWVWRLQPGGSVLSHAGHEAQIETVWLDEHGRLYLGADLGLGVVHSQDMLLAAGQIEAGAWQPREIPWAELVQRFGVVISPAQQFGASGA